MAIWEQIIPAAASLISGAGNAIVGGKMNKKTRAFTYEQNALNREQTWEMWNATNEFNLRTSDPSFIMQRMKQAGLNPWSLNGGDNTVKADTMQTQQFAPPEPKRPDINLNEAYNAFMQSKMQSKQLELMDKQIASQDADINLKNTQAGNLSASTDATVQDMNQKAQLFGGQVEGQSLDNLNKKTSNDKLLTEIAAVGKQMDKTDQEIKNMQTNLSEGLVRIDNLRKQGKILDSENEEKKLSNQLLRATMGSKIEADNAYNELIKRTGGMGKSSFGQMTGSLISETLELIKKRYPGLRIPTFGEWMKN